MKAIPFFLSLICSFGVLKAQFSESFDDGDFTGNPSWRGTTDHFVVNNGELQLSNPEASATTVSYLAVEAPTSLEAPTSWRFNFRLDFAPSDANRLRIYLAADRPELDQAEKAYYLEIGESGSDDAIRFFLRDQDITIPLAKGKDGAVAEAPVNVGIEVQRSSEGLWTLAADYSGGAEYVEQFSITDTTFSVLRYFGFVCRYSATRSEAFFFDDIFIDPLYVDLDPPQLVSATAEEAGRVTVVFNEALDSSSAVEPSHYLIDQGIGQAENVTFDPAQPDRVRLELSSNLTSTLEYTLTAGGIQDVNGNVLSQASVNFIFYDIQPAAAGDLIVSEFMTDPSPSRGLPEAEYLELYNKSNKVLQLAELAVASGGTPEELPGHLLLPGAYITVCDDDDLQDFRAFGPAIAVGSFPSLSNSEDEITLGDASGNTLFSIFYSDDWYDRDDLSEGGVSLEIIQLNGPADCPGNWVGSRSPNGGSPGQENTAAGLTPETVPPQVIDLLVESEFEIRITYSEAMDLNTVLSPQSYLLDPDAGISEIVQGSNNQVVLLLDNPLNTGQTYTLELAASISDCIGNTLPGALTFTVGLPQVPEAGDLLFSELLFNPYPNGEDFVELYNASDKIINLNGLVIENTFKDSGDTLSMIESNILIFPAEYLVLTEEPDDILSRYQVEAPSRLFSNDLPTLDAREGNITLRRPDGLVLDAFDYDEGLHSDLLENKRGVSLERISFDQATQSRSNWHSAAASVGNATPTGPNSQAVSTSDPGQELVSIDNPRFSPDSDGFEDVLLITLNPGRSGYVANIKIFDAQGRLVRDLVRNTLLGNAEIIKWDGLTNEDNKARIGPYVVWVELFEPEGDVIREKKTIVVAGKF